ncbi:MAG: glycosyltransferase family 4 protein [Candidatus Flexifilum sp.]|jgi:glycosyltransferase involved in cell wall biosynthesis
MHIAYNGWFWDQPHTGSGQYVRRLIAALRRVAPQHTLSLIVPEGTAPDGVPDGVQFVPVRTGRSNLAKVRFEQALFPAQVNKLGADLAHVPYWGAPLSSPARLVTTVLDVIPLLYPEYAPTWRHRLYNSLVRASARGSGRIITISQAAKADIVAQLGVPEESVVVTHLAADEVYHPRLGAERDAAVRRKYDLPDQYVLYLGGFDVRKRVAQLLHAFTYVSRAEGENTYLVIAGREPEAWARGGDDPLFPNMRRLADELKIGDYIRWIGYVDEADKPALYRMASVFVFPSRAEGFGLMLLEAMQSGTPVVANNIPVFDEIAGDAAYLVEDGDARAMGGAILSLLLQDPLRETQITRGLGRATAFSWRKTARETLAVYETVMGM